jgi:hypothetical protein
MSHIAVQPAPICGKKAKRFPGDLYTLLIHTTCAEKLSTFRLLLRHRPAQKSLQALKIFEVIYQDHLKYPVTSTVQKNFVKSYTTGMV